MSNTGDCIYNFGKRIRLFNNCSLNYIDCCVRGVVVNSLTVKPKIYMQLILMWNNAIIRLKPLTCQSVHPVR